MQTASYLLMLESNHKWKNVKKVDKKFFQDMFNQSLGHLKTETRKLKKVK